MLSVTILGVVMLGVTFLSVTFLVAGCCYVECFMHEGHNAAFSSAEHSFPAFCYAECHSAVCHYTECCGIRRRP